MRHVRPDGGVSRLSSMFCRQLHTGRSELQQVTEGFAILKITHCERCPGGDAGMVNESTVLP